MRSEDFFFVAGNERLAATLDVADADPKVRVVSLHGAGPSHRLRIGYLTEALARDGVSSLRFDFSGQGESSGLMEASSLAKRLVEARAAVSEISEKLHEKIVVIGTSMGGHVAARLTELVDVAELVLFCPAAYGLRTEEMVFDGAFTAAIRAENSFVDSAAFEAMRNFRGNVTLIVGDADEIIPPAVIEGYKQAAVRAKSLSVITLKDCPHAMHAWLGKNPERLREVYCHVLRICQRATATMPA